MNGFLTCLLIIAWIVLLFYVFRGFGNSQRKKLCQKLETSTDISYLLKFAVSGNYDLDGNPVNHDTAFNHAEVQQTAKKRLRCLVKGIKDPDVFIKVCHISDLDESTITACAEQFSAEDILFNIAPRIKLDEAILRKAAAQFSAEDILFKIHPRVSLDDSILENAVEQISDDEQLKAIVDAEPFRYDEAIRLRAVSHISNTDILFPILFEHPHWAKKTNHLTEEQKTEYGIYQCRRGCHDWTPWVSPDSMPDVPEKVRDCDQIRKCRRCGEIEGKSHEYDYDNRYHEYIDRIPGKYAS